MSVSKIECVLRLRGKGETKVALFRHLAPLTVDAIAREAPISSRVTIHPGVMLCMETRLRLGVEKQRFEFSKAEIAFVPSTSSICFFLSNAKSGRPLNPVGALEEGPEMLSSASVGDVLELRISGSVKGSPGYGET